MPPTVTPTPINITSFLVYPNGTWNTLYYSDDHKSFSEMLHDNPILSVTELRARYIEEENNINN